MPDNTNKKIHPIAKLVNLTITLVAVVVLICIAAELFTSSWCQNARGISVDENSSWEVKACAKYYWNIDVENPTGW